MMQENTLQEVATSLQPRRKGGEQVSRDFDIGDQTLRLFNPPTRPLRLNGKSLRVDTDWPEPGEDEIDLSSALAFTYPGTDLLTCVQANFQGLGMSGRFQNVRQLTLVFRAGNPRGKARAMRVMGYGFDCRGLYRDGEGWRLTQIVEGEIDYGKVLKWWRLGEKGLTRCKAWGRHASGTRMGDSGGPVLRGQCDGRGGATTGCPAAGGAEGV
jgi:hypothetical protein